MLVTLHLLNAVTATKERILGFQAALMQLVKVMQPVETAASTAQMLVSGLNQAFGVVPFELDTKL